MAEPRSDSLLRSRQEAALLLRLDPQNLSASDALRCDLIATLRLSIDSAQADALEGRAADLGRLIVATESLVKLLPSEPPQPTNKRLDPRQIMLETYMAMRHRAHPAISEHGRLVDSLRASLIGLAEEVETGAAAPGEPTATPAAPAAPAGGNVVPLKPPPAAPPKPAPQQQAAPAAPRDWDSSPGGQAWHAWRDAGGDPWSI
jgi:hypothetical protein